MAGSGSWKPFLITTEFICPSARLGEALALYRTRLSEIPSDQATIHLVDEHPSWPEQSFSLWHLRTELAYSPDPGEPLEWDLYSLKAVVSCDPDDDSLTEYFFFEGVRDPARFPATVSLMPLSTYPVDGALDVSGPITTADPAPPRQHIEQGSWIVDLHFLTPQDIEDVGDLIVERTRAWRNISEVTVVGASEPTEVSPVDAPDIAGPLWLEDVQAQVAGRGDGWFSPGKLLWRVRMVVRVDGEPIDIREFSMDPPGAETVRFPSRVDVDKLLE